VVAITAETSNMQDEMDLIWDYLLPAFKDKQMQDGQVTTDLRKRNQTLQTRMVKGKPESPMAMPISGKCYELRPNDQRLKSITFNLKAGICKATIRTRGGARPALWRAIL
jgi:hypothetical protein